MAGNKDIEKKQDKEDEVKFDDLLSAAGELGYYQFGLFMASFPFYAFGVFVYYSQMFITEVPANHWCNIPELENFTAIERRDLGIPKDNSVFGYSQCKMYDVDWAEVLATGQEPDPTWNIVPCQHGWEFNKTEIPYPTIGTDYEWVCSKNSFQATAQAIFFLGSMVGGLTFGWVADRFGRLPAVMLSCFAGCVGGVASTFARNLIEFSAARFVMGMSSDTCMIMAYVIILEYIAPKYRTLVANMSFAIFYALSATVLPWIALACGHWRTICMVTSLPLILGVLAKFFLPESAMWLLSKGRVDDAVNKVLNISRINKKEVPAKMIEKFKISMASSAKKEEENMSWLEIFRRPIVRKVFILVCLLAMCCDIVFDGLIRNVGQLEFDYFMSFSLMSFTEFPSVVIVALIMDKIGRRWMCIIFMAVTCIFCIIGVSTGGMTTVVFVILARFCINMAYTATQQWGPELLPTCVRGSGVAVIHICGYLANFMSPYIVYTKVYIYWLPFAVLGATAGLGMFIAFNLPETAISGMPQTFEDAEELTRNQKNWSMPFLVERQKKKEQRGQVNQSFEAES
ncbi:carcinine transporter-like [Anticarsia gemmatalis]|uniref:carcinine transporter-like n=1 Tax=Anticarsia gemmatalis TaxID=129554 RepID=UPI003F76BD49